MLSDEIKQLRLQNKLSQSELGVICNVTRQTVAKWEKGETTPKTEALAYLCKYFGLEISDFTNELADPEMVAALRKHVPRAEERAAGVSPVQAEGEAYEKNAVPSAAKPCRNRVSAAGIVLQEETFTSAEPLQEETALTVSDPKASEDLTKSASAVPPASRSFVWRVFTVIVTIALAVGALCMGIAAFSAGIVVFTDNLGDVAANNYGYDLSNFVTFLVCAVILAAAAVIAPFAARRLAKKRTRRADESFVGQPV